MNEYYRDLETYEDWDSHKAVILSMVPAQDQVQVERAIQIVEEFHDTPRTMYPGNYNRHPLRVARILLEEFRVTNSHAVIIALCHDLGEWSEYDVAQLENEFGSEIKAGVDMLTWNVNDTWETFFQNIIATGNDDLIKVKMADKLDNNRAALFSDKKHQEKAIEKTQSIVRPFVEKHFPQYWSKFEASLRPLR